MQKDDIIIRRGIVHILDSQSGYLGLSEDLLDMGPDFIEFVREHIFRLLDSDDLKKCGKLTDNLVISSIKNLKETADMNFIHTSQFLAEALYDIMGDSYLIPAADLLVVSFQIESCIHLALLKMNYKESYVHKEKETSSSFNDVRIQRFLPANGRLSEAVIINLSDFQICIAEKKYEMMDGGKQNYLSERFLRCPADLSDKKKFTILNHVILKLASQERDLVKALDIKAKLYEETQTSYFDVNAIGEQLFEVDKEKMTVFQEQMERYDMQYAKFHTKKEATTKNMSYIILKSDSGIEIKVPMELYLSTENLQLSKEVEGGYSVSIKNIEDLKLK